VDWRPFEYLTLESTLPRSYSTFEFTQVGASRCVVAMRVRAREHGVLGLVRIPLGVWVIRRQFRAHYAVLARVLAEDAQAWQTAP